MKFFLAVLGCFCLSSCMFPTCFINPCTPVPGETKLDDRHKTFVAGQAFSLLRFYNPACDSYRKYHVTDTKVENYRTFAGGRAWNEIWFIAVCGQQWKVPVMLDSNNYSEEIIVGTRNAYKFVNGKWVNG